MTEMTRRDYDALKKILDRSQALGNADRIGTLMDLEFCNDDVPLDFEKLLAFGDSDFQHDIIGIYQNFNRTTRTLDNCFLPRCAKAVK